MRNGREGGIATLQFSRSECVGGGREGGSGWDWKWKGGNFAILEEWVEGGGVNEGRGRGWEWKGEKKCNFALCNSCIARLKKQFDFFFPFCSDQLLFYIAPGEAQGLSGESEAIRTAISTGGSTVTVSFYVSQDPVGALRTLATVSET